METVIDARARLLARLRISQDNKTKRNMQIDCQQAANEIECLSELLEVAQETNRRLAPRALLPTEREKAIAAERERWREVVQRLVAGIDHLDKLTREWEPDHSSGADRRGWLLAKDARDDAAMLLGQN